MLTSVARVRPEREGRLIVAAYHALKRSLRVRGAHPGLGAHFQRKANALFHASVEAYYHVLHG